MCECVFPLGEIIDDSGGEDEDEDESDVEHYMQDAQMKLEEEKTAILNDESLLSEVPNTTFLTTELFFCIVLSR